MIALTRKTAGTSGYVSPNIVDLRDINGFSYSGLNDMTAVIQTALNQLAAAGGGRLTIPYSNNTYKIAGPLQTSVSGVNPNCQIYFPNVPLSSKMCAIEIVGIGKNNFATEGFGGVPRNTQGIILESTLATGSGVLPAVLGTPWQNYPGISNRNYVQVHMENLMLRTNTSSANGATHYAGQLSGCNFRNLIAFTSRDIKVDISSSIIQAVEPVNATAGLILPYINNKAVLHMAGTTYMEGYYNTLIAQEHLLIDNILFVGCINGLVCDNAYHAITVTQMLAENCRNNIVMSGSANVLISSYNTEHHADGKWWDFQQDALFQTPEQNLAIATENLNYTRTRGLFITHGNQVTPSVGVGGTFSTNDPTKVFLQGWNNNNYVQLGAPALTPVANTPAQVTGLGVQNGGGGVAIFSFSRPSAGASAITDYSVKYRTAPTAAFADMAHPVTGDVTTFQVGGFPTGVDIEFSLAAINSYGVGSYSAGAHVTLAAGTGTGTDTTVEDTNAAVVYQSSSTAAASISNQNGGTLMALTDTASSVTYAQAYSANRIELTMLVFNDGFDAVEVVVDGTVVGTMNTNGATAYGTVFTYPLSAGQHGNFALRVKTGAGKGTAQFGHIYFDKARLYTV